MKPIVYDAGPEVSCNGYIFYDENNIPLKELPDSVIHYHISYTGSKWAIVLSSMYIFNKKQFDFEYNGLASDRSDDWQELHCFNTPEEAYNVLQTWKEKNLAELRNNPIFKIWKQNNV